MSLDTTPKKEYVKPSMTEVKLVVDEAVFAACKSATSGGRYDAACTGRLWGISLRCNAEGS